MRIRDDLWVRKDLRMVDYGDRIEIHWAYYRDGDDIPVGISALPVELRFTKSVDIAEFDGLLKEASSKPVLDYRRYAKR